MITLTFTAYRLREHNVPDGLIRSGNLYIRNLFEFTAQEKGAYVRQNELQGVVQTLVERSMKKIVIRR